MPRSPLIYVLPPGTTPQLPNTVIASALWNSTMDDLAQDANTPRPLVAGGTGADNSDDALDNLMAAGINRDQAYSKAQRSQQDTVVNGTTVTLVLEEGNDFVFANPVGSNFLLANPSDIATHVGWKGSLCGQQDATGGRTITFGSYWFPIGLGSLPQLPAGANAKWRIDFHIVTATRIDFSLRSVGV